MFGVSEIEKLKFLHAGLQDFCLDTLCSFRHIQGLNEKTSWVDKKIGSFIRKNAFPNASSEKCSNCFETRYILMRE